MKHMSSNKWKRYGEWRATVYTKADFAELEKELREQLKNHYSEEELSRLKVTEVLMKPGQIYEIRWRITPQ
jgi:hypothetical protein